PQGRGGIRAEVWVDAAWWRPGDGARERPLRSLAEALARPGPLTVHLAAGEYRGPFTLPADVRLEGEGPATVLLVEGPEGTVLRAAGPTGGSPGNPGVDGVLLRNLEVRGGTWGLEVAGSVRVSVEKVGFSGQRQGAVRVNSGRFEAVDARFEASVSETVGVLLEAPEDAPSPSPPRSTWLRGTSFTGPFRRAVRLRGAESQALLEDLRFSGPVTAVGMDGGHAEVRRAGAEGGRGAAFSVVEGNLVMRDVRVLGHELAVSAMRARLEVHGLLSVGAERAGLGVVASRGVLLEDIVVRGSGSHGALQLTTSDVDVRRLHVEGAAEYGVVAVGGSLRLRDATVVGVRSADGVTGDGLHLRQVRADVEGVVIRQTTGVCVLAAQNARVLLRDAELERCGQAALMVDTLATLDATGVEARDSGETVLAAMGEGDLRVDALHARGSRQGLLWAECTGVTRVRLGRIRAEDRRGEEAACVERFAEPGPAPR
ncbi:hypothetical protein, partial [Myxococcus sp. AM011]|uniref:hypothetical protein n=1 Tax=Myxococcus sp. AM011 TaxID=2745200 RepID=UPI0020CE297C